MNKGDTLYLELDFTVDEQPLQEGEWDEIEFYIGTNRYLLSEDTIVWDDELGKYCVWVDQSPSFKLDKNTRYQIRLRKGRDVISSNIKKFSVKDSISTKVI